MTLAIWIVWLTAGIGSRPWAAVEGRLTGLVLDEAGTPIPGASLQLRGGDTVHETVADEHGEFALVGLASGQYSLIGSQRGFVSMEYGATRFGGAGNAIVVARDSEQSVTLRLLRGAGISGSIQHADGKSVRSATLSLLRQRIDANGVRVFHQFAARRADASGRFAFVELPPGRYLVRCSPAATADASQTDVTEPTEIRTYFPSAETEAGATQIVLAPGETRDHVDVTLLQGTRSMIRGQVLDTTGSTVGLRYDSVRLAEIVDDVARPLQMSPSVDGTTFSIAGLDPGDYLLTTEPALIGPATTRLAASTRISMHAGERREVALVLAPVTAVRGQLLFRGNQPQPDPSAFIVEMRPVAGSVGVLSRVRPKPNGRILFDDLQPGRYRVRVMQQPGAGARDQWVLEAAMLERRDLADESLELARGQRLDGLQVTLTDQFGGVSGRVTDTNLVPEQEHTILAFPQPSALWSPDPRRIRCARPATDGSFSVLGLPAGQYRVALILDPEPNECLQRKLLERAWRSGVGVAISNGRTETLRLAVQSVRQP